MLDALAQIDDSAAWIAAVAAGLAGLGYLAKKARQVVLWLTRLGAKIERLDELASYELKPNSGHSLKDQVAATQKTLEKHLSESRARGEQQQQRDEATRKLLEEHSTTIAQLATALPIVARATPAPADQEG